MLDDSTPYGIVSSARNWGWKRVSMRVRVLFALAVLAGPGLAAADDPARVALLPIAVHTAGNADYLRQGLDDMLFSRLEKRSGLQPVRGTYNGRPPTQLAEAVDAGRVVEADFVVFGSFTRFGNGASLDLFCARVPPNGTDAVAETREIFVHSGSLGEIIPKLDELVDKVAMFVGGNGNGDAAAVSAEPAESPPGIDYEDLLRRIEALEQAVGAENGDESADGDEAPP